MKKQEDIVPHYYVLYDDVLKKETETGKTIVTDRNVRVILKQKDNSFKIELLESGKSHITSTNMLALELSEQEMQEFTTEQIFALKRVGKKYKKIEFAKPFYYLIDYDFEPLVNLKEKRLFEAVKSTKGFDLCRLDEMDELSIESKRRELRNSEIGSDVYIEVEESNLSPEYRKYISTFVSDHLGEYHLVDYNFFLIPYVDLKNWSKTSHREYLHILNKGIPVLVDKKSDGTLDVVPYYTQTERINSKTLMYEINPITALEIMAVDDTREEIKSCLLEVHKGINGYQLCKKENEKRMELN